MANYQIYVDQVGNGNTATQVSDASPLPTNAVISSGTAIIGNVENAIAISGYAREANLTISSTATQTAALTAGFYDVWASTDCFLKVAATANDVTTTTGYLLRSGNTITMYLPGSEKIGAITASLSGTLFTHRVG